MLYEALSQPVIFFAMSIGGFLSGFFFDLINLLSLFFKKNKILSQIMLFFACFSLFSVFFLLNLKMNYGEFRFFSIFAFFLSFVLQRFLIKNFVANPVRKCYNKLKEKHNERKKNLEKI